MTAEDQRWQEFRNGFPLARSMIYFDTSSHGLQSTAVRQAFHAYLQSWHYEALWESTWQEEIEACLDAFSTLIAAPGTSVALMASLTAAFQAVLYALEWTPDRSEILMSAREWVSLQHVARAHPSARPIFVPAEHYPDSDTFLGHVSDRTRLVVVSHVCYQTGYRSDLRSVVEAAHTSGTSCFVDAYQSLSVADLNVAESGADFVAAGTLKFLLGVPGTPLLYVRPDQLEQLTPRLSGWRGQVEPMNPELNPSPGARRFAGGTWPVQSVYGARAGMELLLATGPKLIAERVERYRRENHARSQQ